MFHSACAQVACDNWCLCAWAGSNNGYRWLACYKLQACALLEWHAQLLLHLQKLHGRKNGKSLLLALQIKSAKSAFHSNSQNLVLSSVSLPEHWCTDGVLPNGEQLAVAAQESQPSRAELHCSETPKHECQPAVPAGSCLTAFQLSICIPEDASHVCMIARLYTYGMF